MLAFQHAVPNEMLHCKLALAIVRWVFNHLPVWITPSYSHISPRIWIQSRVLFQLNRQPTTLKKFNTIENKETTDIFLFIFPDVSTTGIYCLSHCTWEDGGELCPWTVEALLEHWHPLYHPSLLINPSLFHQYIFASTVVFPKHAMMPHETCTQSNTSPWLGNVLFLHQHLT